MNIEGSDFINEINVYKENLPDNIEDVSKFVLIGREKLNSVRAEIRAIDKLGLAQEVRNQKKEEAQLLAEALLDAEVRLGELFQQLPKATKGNQYTGKMIRNSGVTNQNKEWQNGSTAPLADDNQQLPKAQGNRTDLTSSHQCYEVESEPCDTDVTKLNNGKKLVCDSGVTNQNKEWQSNSSVTLPKTKEEITNEMGFDRKTVSRFETLAKNKDLVEQVKQEARENDDVATRTQVLSLAKARKQMQEQKEEQFKEFCDRSEKGKKLYGKLIDCLGFINRLDSEDIHNCMINLDDTMANDMLERLKSLKIQVTLLEQETKKYKGVKIWQDD